MRGTRRWAVAAMLMACALAGAARAEPLAVKTGLWEVSSSGGPGGAGRPMPQVPADALAKLTPEQQAMVQQRMAAAAGGGAAPVVRRICVTQATLNKGFGGTDPNQNCTRTVVSSTASAVELSMVCTGEHPATSTYKVQATDAQTVTGTFDLTMTMKDGKTFPIHRTMQSRWVSADCGNVAPRD